MRNIVKEGSFTLIKFVTDKQELKNEATIALLMIKLCIFLINLSLSGLTDD